MKKLIFIAVVLIATVTVMAMASHFRSVNRLEARLKQLEEQVSAAQSQSESALAASKAARRSSTAAHQALPFDNHSTDIRLAEMEETVAKLTEATEYLMERGQIPPDAKKIQEMLAKLNDGSLPASERLNALRILRRGNSLGDEGVSSALTWLTVATEEGTRREILRSLENLTNGVMKQPMLELAANDPSNSIREQAIENLRVFVGDPLVEQTLWARLATETDPRVRQEILESLTRGPVTPERAASLQARAQNPAASLDERLLALQALRNSRTDVQQIVASFAITAQTTQDPAVKARIFGAFDGMNDPALKVPLVYGLQDADARVRERAADALSGYNSDPAVQQWLRYAADNDPDPRVRREAQQAMQTQQRSPWQGSR